MYLFLFSCHVDGYEMYRKRGLQFNQSKIKVMTIRILRIFRDPVLGLHRIQSIAINRYENNAFSKKST